MVHTAWRVFLFGVVAATSPLALTTTLVVLRSGRGRINGLLYAGAFLAASTAVLLLVVGVGAATSLADDGHPRFQAGLALLFGGALLAAAFYVRRHPHQRPTAAPPPRPNRLAEMTARIGDLGPLQSLGIGLVLGIGGPKRLGITVLVAGTITASGVGTGAGVVIGVGYIVVGTVLVWLPVAMYVMAGRLAEAWIATAQHWVSERQDAVTFWPSLVVGVILVLDGIVSFVRM